MTNPIDELLAAAGKLQKCDWHYFDDDSFLDDDGVDYRKGKLVCGECELCKVNAAADRVRKWRAREMSDEDLLSAYEAPRTGHYHLAGLRAVERAVRERA